MQRLDEGEAFHTSDLHLAAFLVTRGLILWEIDAHRPERVEFVLTPRPQPDDLAAYAEERAVVNVGEFRRALMMLEQALHKALGGEQ